MYAVNFKKLHENAKMPEKKSQDAAAFDLYALEDTCLRPFQVTKVRTGITIEVPRGFKGEVYTRSGYGANGIFIVNQPGKIDADYRGEIFALLIYIPLNFMDFLIAVRDQNKKEILQDYLIKKGDRVAQFEIQEVVPIEFVETESLSKTFRGTGGLGSTGV